MMKFKRVYRSSNDRVAFAIVVDRDRKVVELWRWAAGEPTAVCIANEYYNDPSERFGVLGQMNITAKAAAKAAV